MEVVAPLNPHTPPTHETTAAAPTSVPEVAELRLGPTLLLARSTVTREGHVPADPAVLRGPVGAAGAHDLLAGQAPVGPAQALVVDAYSAAVAESPVQDVLGADAAVGGLGEQVRVVPAVLALAKEILHVRLPLGALGAAPQRDDDRDDDGQRGPEEQGPLLPGAAVVLRLVRLPVHHCCWTVGMLARGELWGGGGGGGELCRQDAQHGSSMFTHTDRTQMSDAR